MAFERDALSLCSMKVYLLAAIFLIACSSDSPTSQLSSGQAIAIVQESLRTKEAPAQLLPTLSLTAVSRGRGLGLSNLGLSNLETCWGWVVDKDPKWEAALNEREVPSSQNQSYWRVVATYTFSTSSVAELVWHVYPGSLVATVEAPC